MQIQLIIPRPLLSGVSLSLTAVVILSGCVGQPRVKAFPAPPSEEIRANLGTIGIVSGTVQTNATIQKPRTRGSGAATGAAEGALWGLQAGAQAGRGGGDFGGVAAIVVWAVTVPVGTVVGAVMGANDGMPAKQRSQTEEQLRLVILNMSLQEKITRLILREAQKQTQHPVVLVPSEQQDVSANIDTLLEVTVWNVGLCGPASSKAPMSAFMQVQVCLVRARDNAELYNHTWLQKAGARPFINWADRQADALREECARISARIAESIVEELFLVYDPKQSGAK